jgi:hypothetical protein
LTLRTFAPPPYTGEKQLDWLSLTPRGYYQRSAGAATYLRWRVGNRIYPLDRWDARYRRPEEARKALRS